MQALLFLLTAALSPAMENMFLNQCVMATNDKQACSCAITQLNGKYNEKTFLALQMGTLSEKEEQEILQDLFLTASDCFVQKECASEISFIVGEQEANKICHCAVSKLKKMEKAEQAAFLTLEGNFIAENEKKFEEIVMREIYPCLPKKLTPIMRENLISECAKETTHRDGKKICACITDEIFKKYSLTGFFRDTFGNSPSLDELMAKSTEKCLQK
ncbi:MAG: hypothetical protein UHC59_07930 [Fibrobacteraceae bacterium]|nr:hypothetical protein [Fibrobacteraceae bacterium]